MLLRRLPEKGNTIGMKNDLRYGMRALCDLLGEGGSGSRRAMGEDIFAESGGAQMCAAAGA